MRDQRSKGDLEVANTEIACNNQCEAMYCENSPLEEMGIV
jgi:hypothetical protein